MPEIYYDEILLTWFCDPGDGHTRPYQIDCPPECTEDHNHQRHRGNAPR